MRRAIVSVILFSAGLIVCSNVWSWSKEGGKVKFSRADANVCQIFARDAAVIILNRQEGRPLEYPWDADSPPFELQKQERANMLVEAQAIPIESTTEKRMAVGEEFTKRAMVNCLRFLLVTQPEQKP